MQSLAESSAELETAPVRGVGHRRIHWEILILLLIGGALRFYGLGAKSLWLDEARAICENRCGLSEIASYCVQTHKAPLREFLIHALVLGPRHQWEATTRLPAALAGLLLPVLVFVLGRAMFGRTAGFLAALFLLLHPWHLEHSQDGRMHGVVLLLATLGLSLLYELLHVRSNWFGWAGLGALLGLSLLFSFLSSMFILALTGIFIIHLAVLARQRGRRWECRRLLGGAALAGLILGLCCLPWLSGARQMVNIYIPEASGVAIAPPPVAQSATHRPTVASQQPTQPAAPAFKNPYGTHWNLATFKGLMTSMGGQSAATLWLAGMLALAGLIELALYRRALLAIPLCWFLAPVPILLLTRAGHFFPDRYLIYGLSVYALLVGNGAVALGRGAGWLAARAGWTPSSGRFINGIAVVLLLPLLACHLLALPGYLRDEKQDWRGAVRFLEDNMQNGDKLVVGDHWAEYPVRLYLRPNLDKQLSLVTNALTFERLARAIMGPQETWYVYWAILPPNIERYLAARMDLVRVFPGSLGEVRVMKRKPNLPLFPAR